jgi:hypothetical protein
LSFLSFSFSYQAEMVYRQAYNTAATAFGPLDARAIAPLRTLTGLLQASEKYAGKWCKRVLL